MVDKELDKKLNNFLKIISEEEAKPDEALKNRNIRFLSTKVMFTSNPPNDSAEWVNDKKEKKYLPLKDGRVGQFLVKNFNEFFKFGGEATAARYTENQFRIRLYGTFDIKNVEILAEITKNAAVVNLERIQTKTPLGEVEYKRGDGILDNIKEIIIKEDFSKIKSKFSKRKSQQLDRSFIEKRLKKIIGNKKDLLSILDKVLDDFIEILEKKKLIDRKNLSEIDIIEYVSSYLKNISKDVSKNSRVEVYNYIKNYVSEEKRDVRLNRVDLLEFSKKLLIENTKTLEKEYGGDIISELNNVIKKSWFGKPPSITATDYETIFEGQLFEFFETEKASFKVRRQEVLNNKSSIVKMKFIGSISCSGYLWVDARIGERAPAGLEKQKLINYFNEWTFRVHDNPNKPFSRVAFNLSVLNVFGKPKTGKETEDTSNLVKKGVSK